MPQKRRPSQASGQAPKPSALQRKMARGQKAPWSRAGKKAKNIGNALLPGNPFG